MVTPGWLKALPTWTTTGTSQSVPYPIGTLICTTLVAVACASPADIGIIINHDQCARARNIFILCYCTEDHVLLVPQSRQRINSRRSPCRPIAGKNRGDQEDDTGQRQGSRIIGLGPEQK